MDKKFKGYKSPIRKLTHFFEQSRDKWKEKCKSAKELVKRLKNRVSFLEKSRDRWKRQAKEYEAEITLLKREQVVLEKEIGTLKQEREEELCNQDGLEAYQIIPAHHSYSVGHVTLFMELVLSAATSLRATERIFELVTKSFGLSLSCPSWYTARLWLLRLGYYKLTRPKEQAKDWIWIVDHSIQIGAQKCFVILGVRLSELPIPERCLGHEDVEPIELFPVTKSDGTIVYQQLEATIEKTGLPRAIIGDKGSDLHAGIQKFRSAHPSCDYIYDIKHKTAAILKQELADDPAWIEFRQLATKSKSQVQQTALAPLAPPKQQSKARYMNVDRLVEWGQKMLLFFDKQSSSASSHFDPSVVEQKLGWVKAFQPQLAQWHQLLSDVVATEQFVRKNGVYNGAGQELKQLLPAIVIDTQQTKKVRKQLLDFVTSQEHNAKDDERLLGSSEVIESVFGKLKRVEQQQAKSGFTGLLLSLPAMVSDTTPEVVQNALETVPTKTMLDWCKEKLGQSLQSLRKEVFASTDETEQKQNPLAVPT